MTRKAVVFFLCFSMSIFLSSESFCSDDGNGLNDIKYNFGLFGDVNFTTKSREKMHSAFYLGEVDLYGTASYGRMNFLVETLVEFDGAATELDMERLWFGYTFDDAFIVRAGKHHTSLGHWNRAYHHGKHFFDTVDRPFILAFEHDGGTLPVHIVGVELEGRVATESISLKYELQMGNGPAIKNNLLVTSMSSDDNPSKQVIMRLSGSPLQMRGLTLGIFGTEYKIISPLTSVTIKEKIIGADLSYNHGGLKMLGEYFRLWNSDKKANLFYLQAGYYIPRYSLTPFARYESMTIDSGDPYMTALGKSADKWQGILGVRYDINERSSIKTQYRKDDEDNSDVKNIFEIQWSFSL